MVYDGEVKKLNDYIVSTHTQFQNIFTIFVLPLLIGMLIRLVFVKWKKGYILSCVFALLSIVVWIWTKTLVNHGADGTVMLLAWMTAMLVIGSLIVGTVSLLIKKIKHKEER